MQNKNSKLEIWTLMYLYCASDRPIHSFFYRAISCKSDNHRCLIYQIYQFFRQSNQSPGSNFDFDTSIHYSIGNHNLVGVAVTMVISTMHEKSCIDLHNARKFEKIPKLSHSHISPSQWWHCGGGIVTDFLSYLGHPTQLPRNVFLTKLSRIRIWNMINFIDICRRMI